MTRAFVKMLCFYFLSNLFVKCEKETLFLATNTGLSFKLLMIFKMSLVIVQGKVWWMQHSKPYLDSIITEKSYPKAENTFLRKRPSKIEKRDLLLERGMLYP